MSVSHCSLSGQILINPVISTKTGHVFEKELILKHIQTTQQCPITGMELNESDLIDIQSPKEDSFIKPKNLGQNNYSDVLLKIQSEWDSLILENFQIRKQLAEIKQEIAHNLYQHDASNLVICRLIKERDEAFRQLNMLKTQIEQTIKEEDENMQNFEEFDYIGIYDELIERINDNSAQLISKRRKREISPELKSLEEIKNFKVKGSYPIHSSAKPGITTLDVKDNLILTGGNDGKAVIFDMLTEKTLFSVERHTKKINEVKFYPDANILAFGMCSQDNSASFYMNYSNDEYDVKEVYRNLVHKAPVTSLSFHPLKEYCLFSSRDATWSFHNLIKGVCLGITKTDTEKEITKSQIHPDGLIFATGESQGLLRIWDLATQSAVLTLEAHKNEINGISFSENGFYLATSALKDNCVNLIDLRKSQIIKKIEFPEKYEIRSVKFDSSGTYLGIAGSQMSLYHVKSGNIFANFNEHTDLVTDMAFGTDCKFIATTSLDRNLKIFE